MVVSCCIHTSTTDSLYFVRRYFWRNNSVELAMIRPYSGIPMDFQCYGILLPPMPCLLCAKSSFPDGFVKQQGKCMGNLPKTHLFRSFGVWARDSPTDHHGPPWTNNRASCFGQAAALSASLQRFSEQVGGGRHQSPSQLPKLA